MNKVIVIGSGCSGLSVATTINMMCSDAIEIKTVEEYHASTESSNSNTVRTVERGIRILSQREDWPISDYPYIERKVHPKHRKNNKYKR